MKNGRRFAVLCAIILILPAVLFAAGEQESAEGAAKKITIGVSNGYFGNEWRTQDIEGIKKVFEYYRGQGIVDELIIQHAGGDINQQIQQSKLNSLPHYSKSPNHHKVEGLKREQGKI